VKSSKEEMNSRKKESERRKAEKRREMESRKCRLCSRRRTCKSKDSDRWVACRVCKVWALCPGHTTEELEMHINAH